MRRCRPRASGTRHRAALREEARAPWADVRPRWEGRLRGIVGCLWNRHLAAAGHGGAGAAREHRSMRVARALGAGAADGLVVEAGGPAGRAQGRRVLRPRGLAVGAATWFLPGWLGVAPAPTGLVALGVVVLPPLALVVSGGYAFMLLAVSGRARSSPPRPWCSCCGRAEAHQAAWAKGSGGRARARSAASRAWSRASKPRSMVVGDTGGRLETTT